ncbi:MAG: glycosyltransferase [Candidatus Marinimicrobia bacterium]|nr:glycosyltransferase [Candidatus Neomarinimicrobiota bacterium]MCF7905350.1 glycosyltransferase [Candidatus Neomarinimicrobiota bacterium]
MKTDLHILVIPSWFPSETSPISGIFVKQQVHALVDKGLRVGVVSPVLGKVTPQEQGGQTFTLLQGNVSNPLPFLPGSTGIFWIRKGMQLFQDYLKKHGTPDLIHAHSALYGGALASRIKEKYKIPYVLTEHSSYISRRDINKWKLRWVKSAFHDADLNLAVSEYMKHSILENYGPGHGQWRVVPNLVDERYFRQQLPALEQEPFIFLNIGNLIEVKAQDVLLKAFAICYGKLGAKIKLRIVGEGELEGDLKKLALQLGIEDALEWIPDVSAETIPSLIAKSHLVVSSSSTETFGMTLAESLAVGRPVVSTDSGGPRDIVSKTVGKLVPKDDPGLLSNALIEMVKHYSDYAAHDLRQYAEGRYHQDIIINRLHEIYKDIVGIQIN